jgi:hypothetical protein
MRLNNDLCLILQIIHMNIFAFITTKIIYIICEDNNLHSIIF